MPPQPTRSLPGIQRRKTDSILYRSFALNQLGIECEKQIYFSIHRLVLFASVPSTAKKAPMRLSRNTHLATTADPFPAIQRGIQCLIDSWLVGRGAARERDTYPESNITKHTSIRFNFQDQLVLFAPVLSTAKKAPMRLSRKTHLATFI